jgi:hypothetical protein
MSYQPAALKFLVFGWRNGSDIIIFLVADFSGRKGGILTIYNGHGKKSISLIHEPDVIE